MGEAITGGINAQHEGELVVDLAVFGVAQRHPLAGGAHRRVEDLVLDLLSLTTDQLAGLPPALVITDERDPLRSQGEQFAANLQAAGVATTATGYDGVMHEFFGAAAVLDKAEQAQRQVAEFVTAACR